jgi:hypothetical protein
LEAAVERRNGKDQCRICGTAFAFPQGATIRAVFIGGAANPDVRFIYADGEEIHRCEISGTARTEPLRELG